MTCRRDDKVLLITISDDDIIDVYKDIHENKPSKLQLEEIKKKIEEETEYTNFRSFIYRATLPEDY